jgi:hypothetical protein
MAQYWRYMVPFWIACAVIALILVAFRRAVSGRPIGGFIGKVPNARRPSRTRPAYVAIDGQLYFRRYAEDDDAVLEDVLLGGPDAAPEGEFAPSTGQRSADLAWARAGAGQQLARRKRESGPYAPVWRLLDRVSKSQW